MAEDRRTGLRPFVAGANHETASLTLRDALFVEDDAVPGLMRRLRDEGLAEVVVLSTCDRVEVVGMADDVAAAERAVLTALTEGGHLTPDELGGATFTREDRDAVTHLFRVAASLESTVIGEPQVLGQVKACHRLARDAGLEAGFLDDLFQAAFGAAKRVRAETAIGDGAVSMASSAVQLVKELHGDLSRLTALVIGAGEMGEMIARDLITGGVKRLLVAHPRDRRAQRLAQMLEGEARAYADLAQAMTEADVLITALGISGTPVTTDMVRAALKARRQRPIFLLDTAQPSDVEAGVHRLDDAFLYDLSDLERIALGNLVGREEAAKTARAIIDEAVEAFLSDRRGRSAAPLVTDLRARFEEVRRASLEDAKGDAEKATHLMMKRLLHGPSTRLREAAAYAELDIETAERLLAVLFETADSDADQS